MNEKITFIKAFWYTKMFNIHLLPFFLIVEFYGRSPYVLLLVQTTINMVIGIQ